MSNFEDLPSVKPIMRVEGDIQSLRKTLNKIKLDISDIKSELDLIKNLIKENKDKEIGGWYWFS
tara:strand:+ start:1165 stop:1356 length:192 start_codon:yes stop_codon:yes gene_type:complete